MRSRKHVAAALLGAALVQGCANLAPTYEREAAPVAPAWPVDTSVSAPAGAADAGTVHWSEFYNDPRLRALIEAALENNRDLRSTALAVESARAQYRVTRAGQWPTLNASAGHTASGAGAVASSTGNAYTNHQYSVELGITAFELDFFGRVRNLKEQALQAFLASEESLRAARISLIAEIATAYLTLAADQELLSLAQGTFDSQSTSLRLTERTFEIGTASRLDVAQAQTSVETARADIATYRTQVSQDTQALALLVGRPLDPQWLPGASRPRIDGLVGLNAGLPSELLQRRPDVLAAERSLQAAQANIGVARARLFPTISLTTTLGTASRALSDLFGSGSRTWSFVPQATLPIFDGGASRANVRVAEVERDAALAAYDKAIQTAFREVADALAQRRDIGEQMAAREALVQATETAFRLSDARYRRGVDSYLSVLDAQRSLYSAQQNLIATRLRHDSNLVTLYSVLGGGWQGEGP